MNNLQEIGNSPYSIDHSSDVELNYAIDLYQVYSDPDITEKDRTKINKKMALVDKKTMKTAIAICTERND